MVHLVCMCPLVCVTQGICSDLVMAHVGSKHCNAMTAGGVFAIMLFVGVFCLFLYVLYLLFSAHSNFPEAGGLQKL